MRETKKADVGVELNAVESQAAAIQAAAAAYREAYAACEAARQQVRDELQRMAELIQTSPGGD